MASGVGSARFQPPAAGPPPLNAVVTSEGNRENSSEKSTAIM